MIRESSIKGGTYGLDCNSRYSYTLVYESIINRKINKQII